MIETPEKQLSMEAIPQQNEPLFTQTHLKSESSTSRASLEMMMRAHERIRNLETQNEQLQQKVTQYQEMRRISNQLFVENERLREVLREREIKIQNLEKLNEKAIIDYVRLERELLGENKECRVKRNLTALPSQLSSPLSPIIRHQRKSPNSSKSHYKSKQHSTNKSRDHTPPKGEEAPLQSRQIFKKEARLQFSSKQKREVNNLEFTFDGGLKYCLGSPKHQQSSTKVLENCFSVNEMSKLVNKVHHRHHDSQLNSQKEKLKQFHTFCSSMEKKYSPAVSLKKEAPKKYPLNVKQCFSPKNYQFRHSTPYSKELNSTSSSQTPHTGFNIWRSENYAFN